MDNALKKVVESNLGLFKQMADGEKFKNTLYCIREAKKNIDNPKILIELLNDAEKHLLLAEQVYIENRHSESINKSFEKIKEILKK